MTESVRTPVEGGILTCGRHASDLRGIVFHASPGHPPESVFIRVNPCL
jgi:hypothetical protein